MHELVAERARLCPGAVAVSYEGRVLSYADLDAWANRLARVLRARGVGVGSLVGVCVGRSERLPVVLLAVLKAGGGYVPLDPEYPADRLAFMLADSGAGLLLVEDEFTVRLSELAGFGGEVFVVDGDGGGDVGVESGAALEVGVVPGDVAYVIYTSGSTGRPKGVLVEHGNVVNLLEGTRERFGFGSDDVWSLFHSYAFDFSVWELWGALVSGGRVVVVPRALTRSPEGLWALLVDEGVTVLNQTPSMFAQVARAAVDSGGVGLARLEWVIFGGEALEAVHVREWFTAVGSA
ncbi:AMP-binding protein, partial [Streptomyces parvus]|uniref:AMP-binding protein n=1 Tax=Streptomyces parvus TaxID=66428 RepID=UPI0016536F74